MKRTTIVQETRSEFQQAMRRRFISEVERLSGRVVMAFISNPSVGSDMDIELFMLAPRGGPGSRAADRVTRKAHRSR